MQSDELRSIINLAERIEDLGSLVPVGASTAQLRSATVWLRDIHDHFVDYYKLVLGSEPTIDCFAFEWPSVPPDVTAMLFGGEELPISDPLMNQTVSSPTVVLGIDWQIGSKTTPIDYTMGGEPFVRKNRAFSDYFQAPIGAHQGTTFSRFQIIEYAAYRRGYVHAEGDRYVKRNPALSQILDKMNEISPIFQRANIDYMLLSITQELLTSPAIRVFRKEAFLNRSPR